jgi:hypothetical protein
LAVYPASPLDPLAAGFVRALLPRARADDLPAGGRSKRSGCFAVFFLVAVLAIAAFN